MFCFKGRAREWDHLAERFKIVGIMVNSQNSREVLKRCRLIGILKRTDAIRKLRKPLGLIEVYAIAQLR